MSETDTGIHWSYTGKDDTYHLYLHDKHVYATKDKRDLDMFAAELLAKMLPRESERDALRAEVERYKRALEKLASHVAPQIDCPPDMKSKPCLLSNPSQCGKCLAGWAISEARKGERRERW